VQIDYLLIRKQKQKAGKTNAKFIPGETVMHQCRLLNMDMTLMTKINTETVEAQRSRYGSWTDRGMGRKIIKLTADVNKALGEAGQEYILLMIQEEENICKNRKRSL